LKKDFTVTISIEEPKPMFDDDGVPIKPEKFQELFIEKAKDVLEEYIEGGLEGDFVISDFGADEAEEFAFYGKIKIDIK